MTTLTGVSSGLAGQVAVTGGNLRLASGASLGSALLTVGADGTLSGLGTIAGHVSINGTVSPGNSIGTLTVVGNATFNAGSIFIVEIEAPDQADLLSVTGTATIDGGTVQVGKLSDEASYQGGQSYRIIEAGTVVRNGGFTFANPFLFLSSELDYGATYVDIVLTAGGAGQDFTSVALTDNQRQAATALNGFEQSGDALAVYNALLLMTDADEARRAFDLASGEIHASGQHVVDQSTGLFSRTLLGQASVGGFGGGMAGGQVFTAPLGYGPSASAAPGIAAIDDATTSAYASGRVAQAWLAPLGGRGTVDVDGNAAKLDWWSLGVAGGYEGAVDVASGSAFVGFGLGYIRSHGSVDALLSSLDADGLHIGAYGGWSDGPWSLAGSLAYAASRVSTERHIVFGGIDRTAKASYWNHTVGFSGEAAYGFDIGGGTTVSPLATLDAGWSGNSGFTETGAGALNLTAGSQSRTRLDTGLGVALSHTFLTESGKVTLEGRALWEHAFSDERPSQNHAFAGSLTAFTVNGPDAGRDRFRVGAGLSFDAADNVSVRARYDGAFSGKQQNHTASVELNVKF
ncbi:MAG: autotransporter domain-containing protein [Aquamicrobium sp.]|nr:autotransporter domain-containing protein [Aquamicrobium sp.]